MNKYKLQSWLNKKLCYLCGCSDVCVASSGGYDPYPIYYCPHCGSEDADAQPVYYYQRFNPLKYLFEYVGKLRSRTYQKQLKRMQECGGDDLPF